MILTLIFCPDSDDGDSASLVLTIMSVARSLADCGNECSHTAAFLRNTDATWREKAIL